MLRLRFGSPEKYVPSFFCDKFNYEESKIDFPTDKFHFSENAGGCRLEFPVSAEENFFGFGLQLKSFNHTGHKLSLRPNSDPVSTTGDSHAPVPFFVSTGGWGMYIDSARYIRAYCGYPRKHIHTETVSDHSIITDVNELYSSTHNSEASRFIIDIPGAKGVDIYLFRGNTITDIISQYNMLSGGGADVPDWGLGTFYRCFAGYSQNEVKDMADYFIKNDLPVSVIGLEPGWQTAAYSCTYEFDRSRYPNPQKLINELKANGYHINLWEHAFIRPSSPLYEPMYNKSGDYEVWGGLIPDFADPAARQIFSDFHKENFVKIGVDGFKLDECDGSDFKESDWSFPECTHFPSGLDGELFHSLFGILYMQTILSALDGTPTLSEVRNSGALAASYPFVLYSDLYDQKDFIRGVTNAGFSGLLWTPEVRDSVSREDFLRRLQTSVFSAHCLINAWYCEKAPWLEFDCEDEVRELLKLRQSLIPMLSDAFKEYHKTGKPPIRALVCDYTDDKETYCIDDEYLFCNDLLVAPMIAGEHERRVYIPQGNWMDFFTGKKVPCGYIDVKTDNIPVFKKSTN